jgi:hypothetical protein
MLEITVQWNGFSGAPGYTNFHFDTVATDQAQVDAAFDSVSQLLSDISNQFPTEGSWSIDNEAKIIEETDGSELGVVGPSTFHPPQAWSGSANIGPGPAGACISYGTNGFPGGKRLRGRMFLVPMQLEAFQNDGTLAASTLTTLNAGFAAYITDNDAVPVVWHRPTTLNPGSTFPIVTQVCRDKVAVLRSRRD